MILLMKPLYLINISSLSSSEFKSSIRQCLVVIIIKSDFAMKFDNTDTIAFRTSASSSSSSGSETRQINFLEAHFLTPPVEGADFLAAAVASALFGIFLPVYTLVVSLVLAILRNHNTFLVSLYIYYCSTKITKSVK